MCTFTAILPTYNEIIKEERKPAGGLPYRIAFNRDESRKRPPGLPPSKIQSETGQSVYPLDPQGSGTWIGANEYGLSGALLNHNPDPGKRPPFLQVLNQKEWTTRGRIVPDALRFTNVPDAMEDLKRLPFGDYLPFRLVLIDGFHHGMILWDGLQVHRSIQERSFQPLFYTSSGMGDDLVYEIRAPIFRRYLLEQTQSEERQDLFHSQFWEDRPHVSICMSRHDAKTVSYSTISYQDSQILFQYNGFAPCESDRKPVTFAHKLILKSGDPRS